jgi:hypothetical protein
MPSLVLILITLLFLPGALSVAQAEGSYEIRKKQGFFVFEDFRQWANLTYRFDDHNSSQGDTTSSSLSHAFQESYNFGLNGAIYDPHLFDASLQAGIIFDQNLNKNETSSSASNNVAYQYHFSGVGLDRSPSPFTLLSFRDIQTVESTFSLPYTSDTTGNEFDIALRNVMLPSRFHFARNAIDIQGGGYDSSSVSYSYSYSAQHTYKDISTTSLGVSFSDQTSRGSTSAEQGSTSNSVLFSNNLSLDTQKKYSLMTQFQLNNYKTDNLPQRSLNLSETFLARPGKALNLEALYSLSNSSSTDFAGQTQESTLNLGEAALKHKLFNSLETELRGRVSYDKLIDGTENRYYARGNIRYTKLLPAASRLVVGVAKGYELVDRRVGSATTTVLEELHPGVHQGDAIDLPLGDGTLRSVVSVKSRSPVFTYVEGVDYMVNLALGRIDILAGSGVRIDMPGTGMDLYISYVVFKDPLISFVIDSFSATSELSLLDNNLQLGASYSDEQQTVISGPAKNSLRDSRSMMLYVSGRHAMFNYRLSYRNVVSGDQSYQAIEGTGRASWDTYNSSFSLVARDRYYLYGANPSTAGYSENSAELSVSYLRNIMTNMKLTVQTNVLDTRSELRGAKDSLSLRAGYIIMLNKTTITMSGQTAWMLYNGGTTRDDSAHVDITRYF